MEIKNETQQKWQGNFTNFVAPQHFTKIIGEEHVSYDHSPNFHQFTI